jgi:hypothetical protein
MYRIGSLFFTWIPLTRARGGVAAGVRAVAVRFNGYLGVGARVLCLSGGGERLRRFLLGYEYSTEYEYSMGTV